MEGGKYPTGDTAKRIISGFQHHLQWQSEWQVPSLDFKRLIPGPKTYCFSDVIIIVVLVVTSIPKPALSQGVQMQIRWPNVSRIIPIVNEITWVTSK
jgi:hypothetical protein